MPRLLDARRPYSRRFRRLPSGCAPAFQPSCLHLVQASNALRRFGLICSALRRGGATLRSPAVSALSGQCLDRAGRQPTTTMASADFCRPFGPPCDGRSHRQDDRPLRVRRVTFLPYTRRIYAGTVRMTLGFESICPLAHRFDASYAIHVLRARSLPAASFGLRLAADALAFRLRVPVIKVSTGTFARPVTSRFAFAPRLTAPGHGAARHARRTIKGGARRLPLAVITRVVKSYQLGVVAWTWWW